MPLTLDHLRLVRRDPREVARLRTWLLSAQAGTVTEMTTMHEHDDSCCRREPWNATLTAIWAAVRPPQRLVLLNLDHRGETVP